MTNFHNVWQDDGEHGCLIFQLKKSRMADSHHLENRQIYNVMMMQNGSLKRIGRLPS